MSDRRMDERDTMVWAAIYAALIPNGNHETVAEHADEAVKEYRARRGGPSHLFYDERDFASEAELIDYLKSELYKRRAWGPRR